MKDVECLIEEVPKSLPVWTQLGKADPQAAIAEANYEPVRLSLESSVEPVAEEREALGWMVNWLALHGHNPRTCITRVGVLNELPAMKEAWSVAKQHKKVKDLLSEVRCGVRGVEYRVDAIHLPYRGQPDLRLLQDRLSWMHARSFLDNHLPDLDPIHEYASGDRVPAPWFKAPLAIRTLARKVSRYISGQVPSYVNPKLATPLGVTLGELINYWNELTAISLYGFFVMLNTRSPTRVVYKRRRFLCDMAREAEISDQAADQVTKALTINSQYTSAPDLVAVHNPQLKPLVQLDSGLFLVTSLVAPSMAPLRITKLLQVAYSGKPTGQLRQRLGKEGEKQVCDLLKKKLRNDVLIANQVLVHKGNTRSKPATDLDVVVYAPGELLIIIQVKWHTLVNSQYEALYQQERARKARQDLERLREQIDAGTVRVQWPVEWGNVDGDDCEQKWFVLTHDTMPLHNLGTSDIKMRSLILIQHLLSRSDHSARDLVNVLVCPPTPTVGESSWETIMYGARKFRVEHPRLHSRQPAPFKDT